MALVEMKKYRLAVRKAVLDDVVRSLQRLGTCEFRDPPEGAAGADFRANLAARLRREEDLLSDARFIQRFALPFAGKRSGGVGRLLGDLPDMTLSELQKRADLDRFAEIVQQFRGFDRRLAEIRSDLSRISAARAALTAIEPIPYPLELFHSGTDLIAAEVGTLPATQAFAWEEAIRQRTSGRTETRLFPVPADAETRLACALYLRSDEALVRTIGEENGWTRLEISRDWNGLPAEELRRLEASEGELRRAEGMLLEQIAERAEEALDLAEKVLDHRRLEKLRIEATLKGVDTEQVHILTFWSPAETLPNLRRVLSAHEDSVDLAEIAPEPDENPPVFLRNGAFAAPYEPLTLMYGAPTYGTVDPTPLMAPFFFLFFGMCFGDAGYGLILGAVLLFFFLKHRMSGPVRRYFIVLLGGALSTVLVGALTGSWMGDMIDAFSFLAPIRPLKNAVKILDPMNDPMTFLGISLALGFFQLIFGLCIALKECLKRRDYLGAFADKGGWILFLVGLAFYGLARSGLLPEGARTPMGAVAGAGALILFLTQGRDKPSLFGKALSGLLSLYNVTAYLGDTLSYSRLLALGLSSAAIGMIVNLLCNLVVDVPYVGFLIAAVIFLGGHLFSVAISILGAFIHSLRLQYVEFFSKFYEANGRAFEPLECRTQYVRLSAPRHDADAASA